MSRLLQTLLSKNHRFQLTQRVIRVLLSSCRISSSVPLSFLNPSASFHPIYIRFLLRCNGTFNRNPPWGTNSSPKTHQAADVWTAISWRQYQRTRTRPSHQQFKHGTSPKPHHPPQAIIFRPEGWFQTSNRNNSWIGYDVTLNLIKVISFSRSWYVWI